MFHLFPFPPNSVPLVVLCARERAREISKSARSSELQVPKIFKNVGDTGTLDSRNRLDLVYDRLNTLVRQKTYEKSPKSPLAGKFFNSPHIIGMYCSLGGRCEYSWTDSHTDS